MESSAGQWQLASQNKRKEKARIAARARRSQEANIIMDMACELHITQEKMRRIDKATIVKLAIDYLKAFDILCRSSSPLVTTNSTSSPSVFTKQQATRPTPALQTKRQKQSSLPNEINSNGREVLRNNNEINQNIENELIDETRLSPSLQEIPTKIIKIDKEQQQQPLRALKQDLSPYSAPVLTTSLIFSPKTIENANEHYLMIEEKANGNPNFILKRDAEISDEDDLTHLAPQAGDISISLDVEQPLEDINLDQGNRLTEDLLCYHTNVSKQTMPLAVNSNFDNHCDNICDKDHDGRAQHTTSWFSTELIFCGNKNQV